MEVDDNNNYNGSTSSQSDTESEDDRGSSGTPEPAHPPQRSVNMLQGCRSVDEFERLNKIDEGTYGVVYRARDKKTGEIVALKKVKMEKEREGFPLTSLREINILLSFHHPSIVDVKEVVVGSSLDSIFMVMEYMEHDLKGLMETMKQPFSQSEVKCLMLQLLGGIKYLHDNWVLHRDLKTSNLLLNNRGELKICDFGLARQYGSPLKPYTHLVVTLWYRRPALGDSGLAFLLPLVIANLDAWIFQISHYEMGSVQRITAEAALNHEWFREVPLPKSKEFMPTFPAQHAQDRRMRSNEEP
ncbi:UNVERIFIED_CONTAM: Cyclin-dependent kinase G-2 [Sesamum latifolium]|uniref:Cyclin-dependent kinase G-2 n=1 Tax=Sesamum latifolium TaxID=2727402 RepID=A0AAW2UXY7_9LAMI